ncbi:hypothetical protein RchiOBHm_Chr1g0314161 [Rosa chinensis]|uniref:Uncharacterized protein n=1 Tax=Rosa chinensis TaxID=74649 RepID=A0A2P6S775_ROSCH|nr:hypothetical protein RchiOBHm_Chr1g0314161 [Rosa chinensis]
MSSRRHHRTGLMISSLVCSSFRDGRWAWRWNKHLGVGIGRHMDRLPIRCALDEDGGMAALLRSSTKGAAW